MAQITENDIYAAPRGRLLAEIEAEAAFTANFTGRAAFSRAVMAALGRVPRHEFVPVELQAYAYLNRPLPIGFDKTISQPFMVALMTDLLNLESGDEVLEVGSGLGYQTAILARLAGRVWSVEIVEEFVSAAEARLKLIGIGTLNSELAMAPAAGPSTRPSTRFWSRRLQRKYLGR